jgi:hypothetical protein
MPRLGQKGNACLPIQAMRTELPKLRADDRNQLLKKLCELQEEDILRGQEPGPTEKKLLDDALAEFVRDGNPGLPWRDVLKRLHAKKPG